MHRLKRKRDFIDGCSCASPRQVGYATLGILMEAQQWPPHITAMALATSFIYLSDHFGVAPHEIATMASNMLKHASHESPELRGAKDYINREL